MVQNFNRLAQTECTMKGSRNEESHQSKAPAIDNNKPRPENKDNLDSRGDIEGNDKSGEHNRKDVKSEKKK